MMRLDNGVTLDISHPATFPDRCVRCDADKPGDSFTLVTNTVELKRLAPRYGPRFTVQVPACSTCRRLMRLQRWFRAFLLLALLATAIEVFVWLYGFDHKLNKLLLAGVVLSFIVPYYVWVTLFPATVDVTATDDEVTYEFKNVDYALDFMDLNSVPDEDEFDEAENRDGQDEWDPDEPEEPRDDAG